MNNIKEKTKQALKSNARQLVIFYFAHICTSLNEKNDRLSEIKSITDSLKARSKDCFDFVDQMRTSATELETIKGIANLASRRDYISRTFCVSSDLMPFM